eukprot:m.95175 g.95175  ORF g.95175 m.95175 type:complete len:1329 (-) comp8940_c0_seq1:145-4131(-)
MSSLPSVTEDGVLRREATMSASSSRPMSGLLSRTLSSSTGANKLPWMTPSKAMPTSRKFSSAHDVDLSFLESERDGLTSSRSEGKVVGYSSSFLEKMPSPLVPPNSSPPSSNNDLEKSFSSNKSSTNVGSYAAMFISKLKQKSKTVAPSYASWATQSTKNLKGISSASILDDGDKSYTPSSGPSRTGKRGKHDQIPFLKDKSLRPGSNMSRNNSQSAVDDAAPSTFHKSHSQSAPLNNTIPMKTPSGRSNDSSSKKRLSNVVEDSNTRSTGNSNQYSLPSSRSDSSVTRILNNNNVPSPTSSRSGKISNSQTSSPVLPYKSHRNSVSQSVREAVRRHNSRTSSSSDELEHSYPAKSGRATFLNNTGQGGSGVDDDEVDDEEEPDVIELMTPKQLTRGNIRASSIAQKLIHSREPSTIESKSVNREGSLDDSNLQKVQRLKSKVRMSYPPSSASKKTGKENSSLHVDTATNSSHVRHSNSNILHSPTRTTATTRNRSPTTTPSLPSSTKTSMDKNVKGSRISNSSSNTNTSLQTPSPPKIVKQRSSSHKSPLPPVEVDESPRPASEVGTDAVANKKPHPPKPTGKKPSGERAIKPANEDELEERIRRQEEIFKQQESERLAHPKSTPSSSRASKRSSQEASRKSSDSPSAPAHKPPLNPTRDSFGDQRSHDSDAFLSPEPPEANESKQTTPTTTTPHPPSSQRQNAYLRRKKNSNSTSSMSPVPSHDDSPSPFSETPSPLPTQQHKPSSSKTATPTRATARHRPPRARTSKSQNQAPGDKDPNLVDIDQLPPLSPMKAGTAWSEALSALERGNVQETWMEKCKGLILMRQLIRDETDFVFENLKEIARALIEEIKNLRSLVSRVAILAASDLFNILGRDTDKVVDSITKALINKSAESSTFIRTECEASLIMMIDSLAPQRAIATLLQSTQAKNKEIRRVIVRLLVLAVRRGGTKILTHKDSSAIFTHVTKLLRDQDQETRYHAREVVNELIAMEGYNKAAEKFLNPQQLNEFMSACETIEQKGVGEMPSSSKTMRSTRAPTKSSKQRHSSGSMEDSDATHLAPSRANTNVSPSPHSALPQERSRTAAAKSASKARLSARQRSNLHSASPFKTSDGDDMLKVIGGDLAANDWKTREKAIGKLHGLVMQSSEKFVGSVNNVFFEFAPRLQDSNSKVNVVALQAFSEMLPLVGDELEHVLTDVLGSMSLGLASKNSTVKRLTEECFALCTDVVSPHILTQPFMSVLLNGNSVVKTSMLLYLEEFVEAACEANMKAAKKYIVGGLVKVYKTDTKVQPKTAGIWKKLFAVLGDDLFQIKSMQGDMRTIVSNML